MGSYFSLILLLIAEAEIDPSECVVDTLIINHGAIPKQNDDGQEPGKYFLEIFPLATIFVQNGQGVHIYPPLVKELWAKCAEDEQVRRMGEDGLQRRDNIRPIMQGDDDRFYVSRHLGYVLHIAKCAANYASIYYENAKTDMVNPDQIKVIANTLPDIVHSEMDGFVELKECMERMKRPEDNERSLIGKIPTLFGTKKENKDECIVTGTSDDQKNEGPNSSGVIIECINIQELKQRPEIKELLQGQLNLTGEINNQIVAEMRCAGEFLVTKMMAKTHLELYEGDEDLSARSVVKPNEPIGQDAEHLYKEHCAASVVRRNAMRQHGMGGMLNASYGTIYLDPELQKALNNLSMHLADSLAAKYLSSGGVDIVRLNSRSDVLMAKNISASFFRIQIRHGKVELKYKIAENEESDLYNYIKSMDDKKFKNWEQKTVAEMIQIFDENQLFLSNEFMKNYLDQNKGQERILYSNMSCLADFMVIHQGKTPKFGEDGKIVPSGYTLLVDKRQIGEEKFAQLAKCLGENDWVHFGREGIEVLDVVEYIHLWEEDKYQVSEELGRLLVNLRCVADYMTLNNRNIRVQSYVLNNMRIYHKTIPRNILREAENSEEFDKMVQCMKEPNKNYQILGKIVPPLIRYEDEHGNGIRIQLKESNNPIMDKILSHAYINEEIAKIIRTKTSCIGYALVEQRNARTSLVRDIEVFDKVFRKVDVRKLPENLLEETGCDQIFRTVDEHKWKMEQRLNENTPKDMILKQFIITDELLLQKIDQQSMCLADCLATHFWPKYVEEITDANHYLKFLTEHSGAAMLRFNFLDDLEFRGILGRFLRNAETVDEFTKCVPKLAKIAEEQRLDTFMAHVHVFNPDQLFLSKEFDLFGCFADWLASKFGAKYIAELDSQEQRIESAKLGLSIYKLKTEQTEEFSAVLKRKLQNAKDDNEEFKKLAKCVPEVKLFKEEIMADASGELLYFFMGNRLEKLDTKYLGLSKKFDLTNLLPDYYHDPAKYENDETENVCLICHEEFESENGAKRLTRCKHLYHATCIKSWLEKHNRCPYCSAKIFT